jgi:LysM repeat protein
MTRAGNNSILRIILLTLFFIVTFTLTLIAAALLLLGPGSSFGSGQLPIAGPIPTPSPAQEPPATPVAAVNTLRSPALGFLVDYPAQWVKQEDSLQVVIAPQAAGLLPDALYETFFKVSIPADDTFEPLDLLTNALAAFPANTRPNNTAPMIIGGQSWTTAQITFADEQSGQAGQALLAATHRNKVGYVIIAAAPAEQWDAQLAMFRGILGSFQFTEQAVLRPTDATRPPTPTPTPTPRLYVVQSGDTLSHIAVEFNITVEALMARNGIEDPRNLRVGQKLIIPSRKR